MSIIKVHRRSEFANKLRGIPLYLNDREIDIINNNETKNFKITPGKHRLIEKLDEGTSNELEFEISKGQEIKIQLTGRSLLIALFYAAILKKNYLKLTILN